MGRTGKLGGLCLALVVVIAAVTAGSSSAMAKHGDIYCDASGKVYKDVAEGCVFCNDILLTPEEQMAGGYYCIKNPDYRYDNNYNYGWELQTAGDKDDFNKRVECNDGAGAVGFGSLNGTNVQAPWIQCNKSSIPEGMQGITCGDDGNSSTIKKNGTKMKENDQFAGGYYCENVNGKWIPRQAEDPSEFVKTLPCEKQYSNTPDTGFVLTKEPNVNGNKVEASWINCQGGLFPTPGNTAVLNEPPPKPFCDIEGFTPKTYREQYQKFAWFEQPLKYILSTMPDIADEIFTSTRRPLLTMMAVCWVIWLCYQIFLFLVGNLPGLGPSGTDAYKTIIAGFFRAMVAAALLFVGSSAVWELTVNPVAGVGLGIAQKIVEGAGFGSGTPAAYGASTNGFDFISAALMYVMKSFNAALMGVIADGLLLIKIAFSKGWGCMIPRLSPLLAGFMIMWFGIKLVVMVPFKMLDATFQLFIIAALMPLLIVLWVFKYTQNYVKKALDMLISTLGLFITMATMIAIICVVLKEVFQTGDESGEVSAWAQNFEWDNLTGNIFVWFGTLWICNKGFDAVGSISESFFGGVQEGPGKALAGHAQTSVNWVEDKAKAAAIGAGAWVARKAPETYQRWHTARQYRREEADNGTGGRRDSGIASAYDEAMAENKWRDDRAKLEKDYLDTKMRTAGHLDPGDKRAAAKWAETEMQRINGGARRPAASSLDPRRTYENYKTDKQAHDPWYRKFYEKFF
jgi:hypothetical protein